VPGTGVDRAVLTGNRQAIPRRPERTVAMPDADAEALNPAKINFHHRLAAEIVSMLPEDREDAWEVLRLTAWMLRAGPSAEPADEPEQPAA
jgi:hypothetical protein